MLVYCIEKKISPINRTVFLNFQKFRVCGIYKNMVHHLVINILNVAAVTIPACESADRAWRDKFQEGKVPG